MYFSLYSFVKYANYQKYTKWVCLFVSSCCKSTHRGDGANRTGLDVMIFPQTDLVGPLEPLI